MGITTLIGWTDHTVNFWQGCNKVSEECRFCYINFPVRRQGLEPFHGPMRTKNWSAPRRWNKAAELAGERHRVFTCSLSDFFHPGADAWRPEAWKIIRDCRNLDWQILSKRPELIADRLPADWGDGYDNVWLGVTVGTTASMPRLQRLTEVPARLRFVSAEPLLERLDFSPHLAAVDWMIVGCESAGKDKRRPMELDWVRGIRDQCRTQDVPLFFKQRYEGTRLVYDGLLDGEICQEWPLSPAMRATT